MRDAIRSLLAEPRVPNPPTRVWRDWVLLVFFLGVAVTEGFVRDDVVWWPWGSIAAFVLVPTLMWRRTHPLTVVVISFGALFAMDLTSILLLSEPIEIFAMGYVVLLPYALARWASGRDIAVGMAIVAITVLASAGPFLDALIGAALFFVLPAGMAFEIRHFSKSRQREHDEIKLFEREQLARDLHDTVAHHVSAIAIQAQAGLTIASTDPEAAVTSLTTIEAEAKRTLAEMRSIVGVLRNETSAELSPQRGVGDIERLARDTDGTTEVRVTLAGDLDDLSPSIDATLYRLAQESITNALRHATNATQINVAIDGKPDSVRLTVRDNGDAGSSLRGGSGYGIIGMTERASLLGGTLNAGRDAKSGWTVTAVIPIDRTST